MQPSLVIFTGGSAFNPTAASLRQLGHHHVAYVVPTTDDGGSSAQILKYFGGPAIGDLRSRLLRLASESTSEARAIKDLLQHRLPSSESTTTNELALNEWREILSGIHPKWKRTISGEFKCTVLRFLQYFDDAVAKKIQESTTSSSSSSSSSSPPPPLGPFDWRNGSIGNFFFTGARLFFGSLNAAIFWWSRVAHIPEGSRVIPAAKRELTRSDDILSMTLGATVQNNSGTVYNVIGQTAISHPPSTSTSTSTSTSSPSPAQDEATTTASKGAGAGAAATAGEPPSSPPSSPPPSDNKIATGLTPFDEDGGKITDIYHVARPSNERVPPPSGNPRALRALDTADVIVYGIGSLFTSIIAGLLPRGVGRSIATNTKALKILCVNGSEDRETHGMSVREYVEAVHRACSVDMNEEDYAVSSVVNCVLLLAGSMLHERNDENWCKKHGIRVVVVHGAPATQDDSVRCLHDPHVLARCLLDVQATFSLEQRDLQENCLSEMVRDRAFSTDDR